jgi:hypothetical protein
MNRPPQISYDPNKSDGGFALLLNAVEKRAKDHFIPYGHWYVDGGLTALHAQGLTCVSYQSLAPVREELLKKMRSEIAKPGMGPETLHTLMAQQTPQEFDLNGDPVLDHFKLKLLTKGSGTQIFSTTFAQWAAREALRRAQPCTLIVRFAPRQRQRPMNELLLGRQDQGELDPVGSLIDADIGAYYNWIKQPEAHWRRPVFLPSLVRRSQASCCHLPFLMEQYPTRTLF